MTSTDRPPEQRPDPDAIRAAAVEKYPEDERVVPLRAVQHKSFIAGAEWAQKNASQPAKKGYVPNGVGLCAWCFGRKAEVCTECSDERSQRADLADLTRAEITPAQHRFREDDDGTCCAVYAYMEVDGREMPLICGRPRSDERHSPLAAAGKQEPRTTREVSDEMVQAFAAERDRPRGYGQIATLKECLAAALAVGAATKEEAQA